MTEHPMQMPRELITRLEGTPFWLDACADAYAAGADAQLEACEKWVGLTMPDRFVESLRAAMRPNPPSLKQQALDELDEAVLCGDSFAASAATAVIRRALEALPDD
jgi:hypothetical protein